MEPADRDAGMPLLPRLAITPGEPAGIGPELAVRLAHSDLAADLVVIGDADLLHEAARVLRQPLNITAYDGSARVSQRQPGELRLLHQPLPVPAVAGTLDPANGAAVLATAGTGSGWCSRRSSPGCRCDTRALPS